MQERVNEINEYLKKSTLRAYCEEKEVSYRKTLNELKDAGYGYNKKTKNYQLHTLKSDNIDYQFTKEEVLALKEMLRNYTKELQVNSLEIDTTILKGNVKTKAYKIDENAIEIWENFCKEHKKYKVQDLISLALIEFAKKHK